MLLSPPKKYQFALFRSISITNRFRSNCPRRSLLYHSYFTALYLGWPLLNIYARGKSVWRSWVRVSVFRILFLCLAWRYHIRYGTKHTHTERTVTPTSRPMAIAESTKINNIAAMTVRVLNSIGWLCGEWTNSSSARVTAKIWGMERDQGFRGKCCPTLCQNIGTGRTPAEILVKRRKCCMAGNSVFIPWNVVHLSGCSSVTSWSFREKLIFSVET